MINLLCVDHVTKILGGAEINLLQLLEQIDRARFAPLVACVQGGVLDKELATRALPRAHFDLASVVSEFRVVNRRFAPLRAFRSLTALHNSAQRLSEIVTANGIQVLLSVTNKDHFTAGFAARRTQRPSIWWVNDIVCRDLFSPPILTAFSFMARRYARALVTVSELGREALIQLGIAPEKITTIYNGIDPNSYQYRDASALRAELNVPADAPVVTILGRVTPWKGQQIFVAAAVALARLFPNAYFWIAGGVFNEDQDFAAQLRKQIDATGLGARLQWLGFRDDVTEVCSASNLLVHCSLKPEAFGRVLIEAMACEIPVVAAADGGVKEIISEGVNGYLVPPGDTAAYVRAIGALLADPARARAFGRAGRECVCTRFSLARTVTQFETLIANTVLNNDQPTTITA